ncbi:tetraacyldisaccharide 4'-kinase [Hyphobacterium sp.]|uniref:tetraacyldisaccharide 4'-kinase n=1 Tax=Hyphobacterium sp. TaxID=2004662 RepID=UPI003BACA04B
MKPPGFWYHPPASWADYLLSALLRPLAPLYAAQVRNRLRKTTPERVDAAVICVGNLTLGGTGKTPITRALLEALKERGLEAHGLSRGYGGKEKGPLRVDRATHTASDVGDEPLMLSSAAPIWIGQDRAAGARQAAAAGAEVIVMDDGHQNPQLHKDLSIIVIDAAAGWGNGRVFPAGPLREPIADGLARADAVVLMTTDEGDVPDFAALGLEDLEIPVLTAWLEAVEPPPAGNLLAFAGIGRPEKFFNALVAAGAELAASRAFGDHHVYSRNELTDLRRAAKAANAQLITTEKDLVRLAPNDRDGILAWPVRARIAEPARLLALLDQALDAAETRR